MNAKESARPTAATVEQAGQERTACGASIPFIDSTTDGSDRQLLVSDVLCRGIENALTMRELRQIMNGDSRSIRLEIERERRSGCPIVSDCQHGYWIAETKAEIETFVRSMQRRAFEIRRTAALVQLAALEEGNDG